MTTSFSRGISTWRFLRLCWRAPLILIVCAGILPRDVEPISQAQPLAFSSQIARGPLLQPRTNACSRSRALWYSAGNDWLSETASFSCDAVCSPFRAVWIYNLSSEFFELILQTQKLVTSGRLALF